MNYIYKCIHIIYALFCITVVTAQESHCFRVYLKDKGDSGFFIDRPEEFLSEEAINRRNKYSIPISEDDLPIAQTHLDKLTALGCKPITASKWQKTVVVSSTDKNIGKKIAKLDIVDSVKWIWKGEHQYTSFYNWNDSSKLSPHDTLMNSPYGYAEKQIEMLNGVELHNAGFKGEGMRVAVIDAGFMHVDRIELFDSLQLIGTRNMVFPGLSVFSEDEHGTKSLSCLAANIPGIMIGTAPNASFLLIKSEDSRSEYPIEEDYWVAAVEYADSVGVDVITSSLGYYFFDKEDLGYSTSQLDGNTAFISQVASKVADKGILLFSSSGNEGNSNWGRITFPADAHNMISVGAITEDGVKSSFSSGNHTSDGRVKPDVVALGTATTVVDGSGNVRYANGTSFATPTLAGLGICLWQALPELSNLEIIELIRRSGDRYESPDAERGYGVPDFFKAYREGKEYVESTR